MNQVEETRIKQIADQASKFEQEQALRKENEEKAKAYNGSNAATVEEQQLQAEYIKSVAATPQPQTMKHNNDTVSPKQVVKKVVIKKVLKKIVGPPISPSSEPKKVEVSYYSMINLAIKQFHLQVVIINYIFVSLGSKVLQEETSEHIAGKQSLSLSVVDNPSTVPATATKQSSPNTPEKIGLGLASRIAALSTNSQVQ
jgi:hypothetical protein